MFSYDLDIESNWVTSAYSSSKKFIDIYFGSEVYENYKWLTFTAHWPITNKQMANVWNFDSVLE
jgi:hypothetical protein